MGKSATTKCGLALIIALAVCAITPVTSLSETHVMIMTYNILDAGMPTDDYSHDWYRLDEIIDLIGGVNPDILAIQEAWEWEHNWPPLESVGSRLGLPYFASPPNEDGCSSLVLFSRFEIVSAENWPDLFVTGAMRAGIQLDSGDILHVFNTHLIGERPDFNSDWVRQQEAKRLIEQMEPYSEGLVVLVGDLNFKIQELLRCAECPSCCLGRPDAWRIKPGQLLEQAGWSLAACEEAGYEQAWVPSGLLPAAQELEIDMEKDELYRLSDHLPVVIELVIDWPNHPRSPSGPPCESEQR